MFARDFLNTVIVDTIFLHAKKTSDAVKWINDAQYIFVQEYFLFVLNFVGHGI